MRFFQFKLASEIHRIFITYITVTTHVLSKILWKSKRKLQGIRLQISSLADHVGGNSDIFLITFSAHLLDSKFSLNFILYYPPIYRWAHYSSNIHLTSTLSHRFRLQGCRLGSFFMSLYCQNNRKHFRFLL